jgi:hypothetical protein
MERRKTVMNICSYGYAEVCYEGQEDECPICELVNDRDSLINDLGEEIVKLKARLQEELP